MPGLYLIHLPHTQQVYHGTKDQASLETTDWSSEKNPDWKKFLQDKGEGQAPDEYVIAVENGLRSFGSDPNALGKFAMASKQEWHKVEMWRKRECYIAAARHILGLPGYLKYIVFRWSDYISRGAMTKTFETRHQPITNGAISGRVPDARTWDDTINHRSRQHSARSNRNRSDSNDADDKTATPDTSNPLVWDSENEDWVQQD